jgi:uncharacterized alkaline shock family protein YloU
MAVNIKNKELDIKNYEEIGNVKVSDEVIMVIAGLAATEVEGVTSISGGITNAVISKTGAKSLSKGVKIAFQEDVVSVDISVTLDYGYSIPKVSAQVQDKVKNTIENMTGLTVASVNVRISGVDMDKMN